MSQDPSDAVSRRDFGRLLGTTTDALIVKRLRAAGAIEPGSV